MGVVVPVDRAVYSLGVHRSKCPVHGPLLLLTWFVALTLLPTSVGDAATILPRGLLRPPPAICRLHLYLRQVSLVLIPAGKLGTCGPVGRDKMASAFDGHSSVLCPQGQPKSCP